MSEPASVQSIPTPAPPPPAPQRPDLDLAPLKNTGWGLRPSEVPSEWTFSAFVGRLVEISGGQASASLTLAVRLVHEAQQRGEPTAWVVRGGGAFFPPDVAAVGVDLAALVVIRAKETLPAARAAEHLLRSGAFGLVVVDLGPEQRLPLPVQTRLAGLAKKHGAAAVCLTEKESHRPSLGSLVSLRLHTARVHAPGQRFRCEARALKDKSKGPGWRHGEVCLGPDGLC